MGNKERQSNYELLRIISMFLIVMAHCSTYFGLTEKYSATLGINKIILDFFHVGGNLGVASFILISGYFMVDQTTNLKRILKLWGQVFFYTVSIWAIWVIVKAIQGGLNYKIIAKQGLFAFFPVLTRHYWYVTAFVIVMLLSPFLNKIIQSLSQRAYSRLLAILIIIFVVIIGGIPKLLTDMVGGRLVAMIVVYFIAGYIKRFRTEKKNNAGKHLLVAFLSFIVLFAGTYLITYVGVKTNNAFLLKNIYFYRPFISPIVIIGSVSLFLGFTELNIKHSKFINVVASCTFGVFLLHSNNIIAPLISKLFPIYKETNSGLIFVYTLGAICVIYIVCTLIDLLRQLTVEKLWFSFLNKHLDSIQAKVMRVIRKIAGGVKKIGRAYYGE